MVFYNSAPSNCILSGLSVSLWADGIIMRKLSSKNRFQDELERTFPSIY
jgi:hypothetical protein